MTSWEQAAAEQVRIALKKIIKEIDWSLYPIESIVEWLKGEENE